MPGKLLSRTSSITLIFNSTYLKGDLTEVLKKPPKDKLLLLDAYEEEMKGSFSSV
jgi:hypothetical protein